MSSKVRAWMILSLAGAALVCGQTAAAQQQPDFSKVQIKATKVSGNIYMLEGQGGNIAASVGEDGIVIVDDQFAPLADKIQAALKELKITDKPMRFVINTHYHGDHTGGNVPFNNAGSTLIAQDNVRKRLEGQGGNIAASVGEDGIVIVDDQFAPLADKIQAALKELKITDKPMRFVINTHYHGDHTGGNVPFNNAGSTLIAQDNVRKRLESGGT